MPGGQIQIFYEKHKCLAEAGYDFEPCSEPRFVPYGCIVVIINTSNFKLE